MAAADAAQAGLWRAAAEAARWAPSILNTQPWHWHRHESVLQLHLDPTRLLPALDPQGRLATLSCGAALHHARIQLAAAGFEAVTQRMPVAGDATILAHLTATPTTRPGYGDVTLARVIKDRRTDRRPIAGYRRIGEDSVRSLVAAGTQPGVVVHHVVDPQREFLAQAAEVAQRAERVDTAKRADLRAWTAHRPLDAGVSYTSVVAPIRRPVGLRDFSDGGETGLHPGFGDDDLADYFIVFTTDDEPLDWLRAGETASAVWLTATVHGFAVSALSDVVEIDEARAMVQTLIPGSLYAQLVLRLGPQGHPAPAPPSSRRALRDIFDED